MADQFANSEIDDIERITLEHYQSNADGFWVGTRDHDVSQNIDALLRALPGGRTLDILDLGCGPGRDLLTFKNMGHRATGLDGSSVFCEMAREYSGCPVLHQRFSDLHLDQGSFDGVFANAALFHLPGRLYPEVLTKLYHTLRPAGILFMSNPRGNAEGWQGTRYGNFIEFEQSETLLTEAGFSIVEHYYRPTGSPRHQQPWLAIVSQRVD